MYMYNIGKKNYNIFMTGTNLDDGGLRAGLEGVSQTALAAVLTILVESHLTNT